MYSRWSFALIAGVASSAVLAGSPFRGRATAEDHATLPPGAIEHVLVIDLENESFATTFGAGSPATYLNSTLLRKGRLVVNYYGTSHASLGNYLSPSFRTGLDANDEQRLYRPHEAAVLRRRIHERRAGNRCTG